MVDAKLFHMLLFVQLLSVGLLQLIVLCINFCSGISNFVNGLFPEGLIPKYLVQVPECLIVALKQSPIL